MNHPVEPTTMGYLEVISGCMYSGKTEELIRQMKRCNYARIPYLVFKPKLDDRYSENEVTTHDQYSINAIVIEDINQVFQHITGNTKVVGIDEAQFFSEEIVEVCQKLAQHGRRVVVAGLDTDWKGEPFGYMPQLLAMADVVKKQYAICMVCGQPATRTQRVVADNQDILVGSFNMYEARCRKHHDPQEAIKPTQSSSVHV